MNWSAKIIQHHKKQRIAVYFEKDSKGKKDRIAPLSPKTLEMLRDYCTLY